MCGLFGWMLSEEALRDGELHTLAAALSHFAERRGDDSWGVARRSDGPYEIIKRTGSIKKTCRVRDILGPTVIGHTRKATTGAITQPNAHPFLIGKTIGAHNGFVFDHKELNKKNNTEYDVDSMHLIAHLDANKPIGELSASGTVTWVNTDEPGTIYVGRGFSSDFAIWGIGKHAKPLGVVWASINMWVTDAIEMAGFSEAFEYVTKTGNKYVLKNFGCLEGGEFPLSATIKYPSTGQGTYNHACGYRGHTEYDERNNDVNYWSRRAREQNQSNVINVTREDIEHLPASLKKSQKVGGMASGQGKEAFETTTQCDGCHHWGATADSYEANAEGIVYHQSIGQHLCYDCFAWWGCETGVPNAAVPPLRLSMDERFLR